MERRWSRLYACSFAVMEDTLKNTSKGAMLSDFYIIVKKYEYNSDWDNMKEDLGRFQQKYDSVSFGLAGNLSLALAQAMLNPKKQRRPIKKLFRDYYELLQLADNQKSSSGWWNAFNFKAKDFLKKHSESRLLLVMLLEANQRKNDDSDIRF